MNNLLCIFSYYWSIFSFRPLPNRVLPSLFQWKCSYQGLSDFHVAQCNSSKSSSRMNSVATHSLYNFISRMSFICCLYVNHSQMYVSSLDFFPKFQTHISSCLLDISAWMPHRHLKQICPKLYFSLFLSPSPICFPSFLAQNVVVILDFSFSLPISDPSGDLSAIPSKRN